MPAINLTSAPWRLLSEGLRRARRRDLRSGFKAFAQDHAERKVRIRVDPVYPDIARKMKLNGVVRVQVVVSPNGNVKETKVIGGHPILVTAAVDAVKKWKFDPASAETTGILEIKFDPGN